MNPNQESKGPLVGIVIIVLILVFGGVYLASTQRTDDASLLDLGQTATSTSEFGPESESTDLETLEAEAESTDFGTLEAELDGLEAEIGN